MTRDGPSRRDLLGLAAGTSTLGVLAGGRTTALVSELETLSARARSGALDLELSLPASDGSRGPYESVDEATIPVPPLEPGDSGSDTVCYRVDGNPGRVWLRGSVTGSAALASELELRVFAGPEGAESEPVVGAYTPVDEVVAGPFGAGLMPTGCRYVGKLEVDDSDASFVAEGGTATGDDTYRFAAGGLETDVRVADVTTVEEDDTVEVSTVDLAVVDGAPLCKAIVSGGPPNDGDSQSSSGSLTFESGCTTTFDDLHAPSKPQGGTYGISNVELYACEDACVVDDPRCVRFDWRLPDDATGLGGESLRFDLDFRTVQCRHDPQPTNPWG
jgi:hypothetical protein